jgi:glycosyltransferase involved in cell wall biosynthesis
MNGSTAADRGSSPRLDATVLICTYNRASHLGATLDTLARMEAPGLTWDVLVVDNNSNDDTAAVVQSRVAGYPVPLRYLFEPRQGKSNALNTGMAATDADVIAFTDDDVKIPRDWLTRTMAALKTHNCDYVGGRVTPWWEAAPPRWLPTTNGRLWAAIALLDYGPEPMRFGRRIPLGVNMAVKKSVIDRVGEFNPRMGRTAGTLLGQEQREWFLRAHADGMVGYYAPDIVVEHWIPRDRLTKSYFRRWFYWRGIGRAMLYAQTGKDMESPEQSQLDFTQVKHVLGVPRYLFRNALVALRDVVSAKLRGDHANAFERELWLWMFAGIVKQRLKDRRPPAPVGALAKS